MSGKDQYLREKEGKKPTQTYIYICVYIYELKLVQDLGIYKLKTGASYKLRTGPSFSLFSPIFIVFWGMLEAQIVSHCVKIVFLQKFGDVKKEVFEKKIAFLFFMLELETEKRNKKWKRPNNPIKIGFFKVVIQKCEKSKKWILSTNCLTLFVSGREKKRAFSCTLSVLAKIFLDQNSVKQEAL